MAAARAGVVARVEAETEAAAAAALVAVETAARREAAANSHLWVPGAEAVAAWPAEAEEEARAA